MNFIQEGDKVSDFVIVENLGKSIHGSSYLALRNGEFKVLKGLKEDLEGFGLEAIEPFINFEHQNFLKIEGYFEYKGSNFFISSFKQKNLAKLLNENLSIMEKLRTIKSLFSAIIQWHKDGLVHGNLKPTNIFIEDYKIILSDPCLPAIIREEFEGLNIYDFAFLAPEQITEYTTQKETDLFSFANIVYLFLCNSFPFGDIEPIEDYIGKIVIDEPKYNEAIIKIFPKNDIFWKCLKSFFSKEASERYEKVEVFIDFLNSEEFNKVSQEQRKKMVLIKSPTPSPHKKPKLSIGKYSVLQELGQGAFSKVFLACEQSLTKNFALKVLNIDKMSHFENFKYESNVLKLINHNNVVKWYDFLEEYRTIVMEYAEGYNLSYIISNYGLMDYKIVLPIIFSLCEALKNIHEIGILHLDIKPSNLILSPKGDLKLIDFGLAGIYKFSKERQLSQKIMGTLNFMSPEQIYNDKLDERSDLYSVGALFYRLITGKNPYAADSIQAKIEKFKSEKLVEPKKIVKSTPEEISDLIVNLLKIKKSERDKNVEEVLKVLKHFTKDITLKDTASEIYDGNKIRTRHSSIKEEKDEIRITSKIKIKKILIDEKSKPRQDDKAKFEPRKNKFFLPLIVSLSLFLLILTFIFINKNSYYYANINFPEGLKLESINVNGKDVILKNNKIRLKKNTIHNILIKKPGFFPEEFKITFIKDGPNIINIPKLSNFIFKSNFNEKYYYLRGYREELLTVNEKYYIPPKDYTLIYKVEGYEIFEKRIFISENSPLELEAPELKKKEAQISFKIVAPYSMKLISIKSIQDNKIIPNISGSFSWDKKLSLVLEIGAYEFTIRENFEGGREKIFKVTLENTCKTLNIIWDYDKIICK